MAQHPLPGTAAVVLPPRTVRFRGVRHTTTHHPSLLPNNNNTISASSSTLNDSPATINSVVDEAAETPRSSASVHVVDSSSHTSTHQQHHHAQHTTTLFPDNRLSTTKYTALNFIPKSLFEQFKRVANVYFLVLSVLMLIGTYFPKTFDTPLTPWSTFFPLVVVLAFTMAKEAWEDTKRRRNDLLTDQRPSRVLETLQDHADFVPVHWCDLQVGNIVRVKGDEPVPADLLVLRSSEKEQTCFVETSNIDGETNLKMKRAVVGLPNTITTLKKCVCEAPNGRVHSFKGYVQLTDRPASEILACDETSLLLRGSSVQNVDWVDGIVVYTGIDSKLARNASKPRLKLSSVEKTMNRLIWMVFGWLFTLVTLTLILLLSNRVKLQYLHGSGESFWFPYPIAYWFTFIILFSNALPMSLYVTVEMVNFGQAYFIDHDIDLYDEETDTAARAVTSNLNSDLGQVEYLFSDKTGTLTRNVMTLRRICLYDGTTFGAPLNPVAAARHDGDDENGNDDDNDDDEENPYFRLVDFAESAQSTMQKPLHVTACQFLTCLAVAHTVVMDKETNEYRAESPDEKALAEGARDLGFVFIGTINGISRFRTRDGIEHSYEILAVNEFTSTRKRMSILTRNLATNEYMLMCKGADNVMFARSVMTQQDKPELEKRLSEFADEGLRTLIIAMRSVPSTQALEWLAHYKAAKASVLDRDRLCEEVAAEIECELQVLGATAIEDRLQDGVPETLESLRQAGIKIWVLTGDKLETAINIGFSSRLLDSSMHLVKVSGATKEEVTSQLKRLGELCGDRLVPAEMSFALVAKERITKAARWWLKNFASDKNTSSSSGGILREPLLVREQQQQQSDIENGHDDDTRHDEDNNDDEPNLAMAITGQALEHALQDMELRSLFLSIALSCSCVLACRVSPAQKAEVVKVVKKGASASASRFAPTPVTLAIGDGANDVAMIQEAQIGVGISGHEGLQACNAADFAIAQFRFLKRLLLVHGRWSYRRMAKVVLYSLYKNLVLILVLFYYQLYAMYSGISLFESMVQAGFNFFLGMGPVAMGLFDREISARFALLHPQLYVSGRKNLNLNPVKLAWRVVEAFVHSYVVFFLPFAVVNTQGFSVPTGRELINVYMGSVDLYVFGVVTYTCLIFVMFYKNLFEASSFTRYNAAAMAFSVGLYFTFLFIYDLVPLFNAEFLHVSEIALSRPATWLLVILCVACCFVFDATTRLLRLEFKPHAVDIFIELDRVALKLERLHEKKKRRQQEELNQSRLGIGVRRVGRRLRNLMNPNHREIIDRVQNITETDLETFGMDSPSLRSSLRSSFDFSAPRRLPSSSSLLDV